MRINSKAWMARKPATAQILQLCLAWIEHYGGALFLTGLVVFVALLTVLRISGTSIGYLHIELFHGAAGDDGRVLGWPRRIRSDEFVVSTSWTVAQARAGFPANNPLFGLSGQKLVFYDIPVKDFTLLFKPHNWGYFLLPLEQGFAFKWWFRAALFLLATYLVLLRLSKQHVLFSILGALGLFFMPQFQWFYSVTLMDIVTYYFLLFEVFIRLVRGRTQKALFSYALLFAYLSVALILFFYPPTQAGLGIVFVIFALGFLWQERRQIEPARWKPLGLALGLVVLIVGASLGLFYQQYRAALQTISGTIYPGQRHYAGPGLPLTYLLGGIFNFQLLNDAITIPPFLGANQSEAGSFFFFGLFLLPVFAVQLIWRWGKHKALDTWALLLCLSFLGLLLWEIFGLPEIIAQLPLISLITAYRLITPLGVLNLILITWYLYRMPAGHGRRYTWAAAGYAGLICLFYLGFGFWIRAHFPAFLLSGPAVVAAALLTGLTCFALLRQQRLIFAALLLGFAFFSTYKVNPLYRGLGELTNGDMVHAVQEIAQQGAVKQDQAKPIWILYAQMSAFNLLQDAGVHALNGIYYYPDLALWRALDPQGSYEFVYNRYGYARFTADADQAGQFELKPGNVDYFTVIVDPCSPELMKLGVKYHVFNGPNPYACLKEIKQVVYPATTFYIYERRP